MRFFGVELTGINTEGPFECLDDNCLVKKLNIGKGGTVDTVCLACGLQGLIGDVKQSTRPNVGISMRNDGEVYNSTSHE